MKVRVKKPVSEMTPQERRERLKILLRAQRIRNDFGIRRVPSVDYLDGQTQREEDAQPKSEGRTSGLKEYSRLLAAMVFLLLLLTFLFWFVWIARSHLLHLIAKITIVASWLLTLVAITEKFHKKDDSQ